MVNTILGTKVKQTRQFTENGKSIPVTVVQAGPCWVVEDVRGGHYRSLKLGFGTTKHITKPEAGVIKKAGLDMKPRFLREVRVTEDEATSVGQQISATDVFAVGDTVRVTGVSKGKGFAGVMKRHGFKGGPKTHGQSDRARAPGSIGQTTTPGRVYKGKRMAGRMGSERVTVKGLEIISIDTELNNVTIKGVIPGPVSGLVTIQKENE